MPIYEYSCRECRQVTEVLVRPGSEPDLVCRGCGSKELERRFSCFGTGPASTGSSVNSGTGFT